MKILLFCSEAPNQIALATKLHDSIGLAGIAVLHSNTGATIRRIRSWRTLKRKIRHRILGRPLVRAWAEMQAMYRSQYLEFPILPQCAVQDINTSEVENWVGQEEPDLVLVSGTNLLRLPLIEAIQKSGKVMNLHTGISPYVKGGPNCTNWCLALGQPGLIGNTIMWIDSGIDSGGLIATERTLLSGSETITDLHIKVMEHAHDLYVRAAKRYSNRLPLPDVAQAEIGMGRLFYSRDWTHREDIKAVQFFKSEYALLAQAPPRQELRLVAME